MGLQTGVDLGGTKIEAAVLSPDGAVMARRRTPTPKGDYDATVAAVAALTESVEAEAGGQSALVGIGTPGTLSPQTGLLRNSNSVVLNGRPLDRDLARAIGRPVLLENDANCFALAEARSGAGVGANVVFGVILGTGVGGGLVVGGQILQGRNAIAGEWGHNPLPALPGELPGPACYCGRHGCIETWLSGPAMATDDGRGWTAEQIVAADDATSHATLARYDDRLARALAGIVNVLDPEVIVLGGGLSNLPGLAERLPAAMRPHIFSDSFETPIVRHQLGDSAGVIGAAWLCNKGTP